MKAKELREKSVSELKASLNTARREQFKLRLTKAGGEMTETHKIKLLRRDIARINSVITEKEVSKTANDKSVKSVKSLKSKKGVA